MKLESDKDDFVRRGSGWLTGWTYRDRFMQSSDHQKSNDQRIKCGNCGLDTQKSYRELPEDKKSECIISSVWEKYSFFVFNMMEKEASFRKSLDFIVLFESDSQ